MKWVMIIMIIASYMKLNNFETERSFIFRTNPEEALKGIKIA